MTIVEGKLSGRLYKWLLERQDTLKAPPYQIVPVSRAETTPSSSPAPVNVADLIGGIMSDVPEEVFAMLPVDGASQLDHYLYGAPKRSK